MSDTMKRMWTERQVRALGVDAVEQKSNLKVFENIVDKDGHSRFIDFDPKSTYEMEGLTISYAKASLSGTHLLIALAGSFANTSVTPLNVDLAVFELPSWINDKIVSVWGDFLENKSVQLTANDWTTQSQGIALRKKANGLSLYTTGTSTLTKDRSFRVQFDILIDDE